MEGLFGKIDVEVSVLFSARWAVDEIEEILDRPDATKLLDFTEEERPEILREHARMIVERMVNQIPVILFKLLNQALQDAIQSHLKNHVELLLKEHWQSLGLPKDFTIAHSSKLAKGFKKMTSSLIH